MELGEGAAVPAVRLGDFLPERINDLIAALLIGDVRERIRIRSSSVGKTAGFVSAHAVIAPA